jgi:arabinose-5-phosphate isomerase
MSKPLTHAQLAAPEERLDRVRQVFLAQAQALHAVAGRVGVEVLEAIGLILAARGRVVIAGMGMIRADDVAILISYSGETDEVLKLLPYLRHIRAPLIAITGGRDSTLARHATVTLDVAVERESCPHNLAPTTSTTATLVMGDALAIALMHARDFVPNEFARFQPGGSVGRKLLTSARDVMHADCA